MIRSLERSEFNWLEAGLREFFAELSKSIPDVFAPDAARVFAGLYLGGGARSSASLLTLGALDEPGPVAFLLARVHDRPARLPSRVLTLDAAYTLPDFRGRGHMSALLAQAEDFARGQGAERLELGTPGVGPAAAFWRARGFADEFIQMGKAVAANSGT